MYVCVNNRWKIREKERERCCPVVLCNVLLYDNNDVH